MTPETTDELLSEQVDYYRARAPEYEQWFRREGRYSRGPEADARWFAEFELAQARLRAFCARGDVLEIACGTGQSTSILAETATSLIALDAAPEMIAEARRRPDLADVRFVRADALAWEPPGTFDAIVFTFWLSHVPVDRTREFWGFVRRSLSPGGRVFFADSLYAPWATAIDHELEGPDATSVTRRLNDGRTFRIVKRFFDPAGLETELRGLGWSMSVRPTGELLLTGEAAPVPGEQEA
jgi:demethylmenaquinone methyltransferase/2-methoxy-6-polyprenyl-1,4-benzoquinol methylase